MKKTTQKQTMPQSGIDRIEPRIVQLAEPFLSAEDFELVQVQFVSHDKEKILRISVDKEGGITLDDCVYISRQLGDLLDVHLEDMPPYRLEVSSPGPRRPLNSKRDFHRFAGKRIKIQFHDSTGTNKKVTGILNTVNDASFIVSVDGANLEISDQQLIKAMLAEE